MIGRTIAHYQVLDTLGQGGMGVVYKARDQQLDRLVAIKVLTAEKVANAERQLRFVHEASDAELTRPASPETSEGSILGTVCYMSPEQAEARKTDARSDIFSFGAVLYEMATGQRAFLGRSKISTLAAVLQSEAKPPAE